MENVEPWFPRKWKRNSIVVFEKMPLQALSSLLYGNVSLKKLTAFQIKILVVYRKSPFSAMQHQKTKEASKLKLEGRRQSSTTRKETEQIIGRIPKSNGGIHKRETVDNELNFTQKSISSNNHCHSQTLPLTKFTFTANLHRLHCPHSIEK